MNCGDQTSMALPLLRAKIVSLMSLMFPWKRDAAFGPTLRISVSPVYCPRDDTLSNGMSNSKSVTLTSS